MEIIIITCLLIIIVLLAKDKIIIKKTVKDNQLQPDVNQPLPEIMGKPKPITRLVVPNDETNHQLQVLGGTHSIPEPATNEKDLSKKLPQKDKDEVFDESPDLDEEEEDLKENGYPDGDDGLATGVTFEELGTVNKVLQQEMLGPAMEKEAIAIIQKTHGTEFYHLLENSMEGASQKIAALLDRHLATEEHSGSSGRQGGFDKFNIGEFV